jgi:hypothetical protein
MSGIKRLPRMEKSAYKPSDLWTEEEHELFLKYCPSPRDKAFHSMAYDTSARPGELVLLNGNFTQMMMISFEVLNAVLELMVLI